MKIYIYILLLLLCFNSKGYAHGLPKESNAIVVMKSDRWIAGTGILLNNTQKDGKAYVLTLHADFYSNLGNVTFHFGNGYNNIGVNSITNFKLVKSFGYYAVKGDVIHVDLFEIDKEQFSSFTNQYAYYMGWNRSLNVNNESDKFTEIYSMDGEWKLAEHRNTLFSSCEGGGCTIERFWALDLSPFKDYVYGESFGFPLLDNNGRLIGFTSGVWDYTTGRSNQKNSSTSRYLYLKLNALWNEGLNEYLDPENTGVVQLDGMAWGNNDILISNEIITSSLQLRGRNIAIDNTVLESGSNSVIDGELTIIKPSFIAKNGSSVLIKSRVKETKSLRSAKISEFLQETASLHESILATTTQLFPNPTDGILNFECSDTEALCDVKIYSISGGVVYSNRAQKSGDIIDLSAFAKGMYLAKITVKGETTTQKIILK